MKKSMKINAAKYGLRLITFETGHYDMCGYFKDNETKKVCIFFIPWMQEPPHRFRHDELWGISRPFCKRIERLHWRIQQLYGLEGIFPTGKADYFQWKRHNGERYPVQKLTFHLFISYLLYMSGSQRTVLIQKGDCSRIKNKKTDTDDYLLTLCQ